MLIFHFFALIFRSTKNITVCLVPHKIYVQTNRYALFTHQFVLLYIPVHQITTVPSSLPPTPRTV